MKTSPNGIAMIEGFEGLRLMAYQDIAGVWTVGYGHATGVHPGVVITQEHAQELLQEDLETAENAVNSYVKVELTQNEFDALVSFTFNLGAETLRTCPLLKLLNQGNEAGVAQHWVKYCNSGGKPCQDLLERREKELALYQS